MNDICRIDGCGRRRKCRNGLCGMHNERLRVHGTTDDQRPTPQQRFWAKVSKTSDCWLWTANRLGSGYGGFSYNGMKLAHRVSYEWAKGPIPAGLTIDHLCGVPLCVNPSHLEAVTRRVNTLRGSAPHVLLHHLNMCKRGHDLTPENSIIRPEGRRCRTCSTEERAKRTKRHAAERKAALEARGPLLVTSASAADVRSWAAAAGIEAPTRGPLPQLVIAAYLVAHPESKERAA